LNKEHFNFTNYSNSGLFVNTDKFYFTNYARDAGYIINRLSQQYSMDIYFPFYICSSALFFLKNSPERIKFYSLTNDLKINIESLFDKLDTNSNPNKILYIVHYYGFSDPNYSLIINYCKNNNILVVEDCAISLFSKYNNQYLGLSADIGLYSLVKNTCLFDGGAIHISSRLKEKCLTDGIDIFPHRTKNSDYKRISKSIVRKLLLKYFNQNVLEHINNIFGKSSADNLMGSNDNYEIRPISKISKYLLRYSIEDYISQHQIDNYNYLHEEFGENTFKWMKIKEGIVPHSFPLIVNNKDKAIDKLKRNHIAILDLWDMKQIPLNLMNNLSMINMATELSQSFINIPIHLGISKKELSSIKRLIKYQIIVK
jgi:hypothetical protein